MGLTRVDVHLTHLSVLYQKFTGNMGSTNFHLAMFRPPVAMFRLDQVMFRLDVAMLRSWRTGQVAVSKLRGIWSTVRTGLRQAVRQTLTHAMRRQRERFPCRLKHLFMLHAAPGNLPEKILVPNTPTRSTHCHSDGRGHNFQEKECNDSSLE